MVNIGVQALKSFSEMVNKFMLSSVKSVENVNVQDCSSVQKITFINRGQIIGGTLTILNEAFCDMDTMLTSKDKTQVQKMAQFAIDKAIEQDMKQDSGLIGFLSLNLGVTTTEVTSRIKNITNLRLSDIVINSLIQKASVSQDFTFINEGEYNVQDTFIGNQLKIFAKSVTDTVTDSIISDSFLGSIIEKDTQKEDQKSEGISDILSSFSFVLIIIILGVIGLVYFILPTLTDEGGKLDVDKIGKMARMAEGIPI